MATRFAAREVLVLATEDYCSGRSNSENREGNDGSISWISEDELQEEDHLGKQSFVPKAILHW